MKMVFQIDHGNRRDHNLVLAVLLLESRQQAANWFGFPFGDEAGSLLPFCNPIVGTLTCSEVDQHVWI
jgi:hypothetical protein